MSRILLRASANTEHENPLPYAVVDLDVALREVIAFRLVAASMHRKADVEFLEAFYWARHVAFFDDDLDLSELLTEEQCALFEDRGAVLLPDSVELPDPSRTECDQMIVRQDGQVAWFCYPEHGDEHVTTEGVTLAALDDFLLQCGLLHQCATGDPGCLHDAHGNIVHQPGGDR